jgi:hypothetical protein
MLCVLHFLNWLVVSWTLSNRGSAIRAAIFRLLKGVLIASQWNSNFYTTIKHRIVCNLTIFEIHIARGPSNLKLCHATTSNCLSVITLNMSVSPRDCLCGEALWEPGVRG